MTSSLTPSFTEDFLATIQSLDPFGHRLQILDVGTGTVRIPIAICRQRGGIEFTAVDRSGGILQRAQRRVAEAGLADTIRIDAADAHELPHAAWSFDAVISNGLVHHLSDRVAALREMTRVLRPGGLLFVRDSLPQTDAESIADVLTRRADGATIRSASSRPFRIALTLPAARTLASAVGLPPECVRLAGTRH